MKVNLFFILTIFVVSTSTVFSQNNIISCSLKSKNIGDPISYATIWLPESSIWTSSDSNGVFNITIPSNLKNSSLAFSCIGYYDTLISISKLIKAPIVALRQKSVELSGVTIYSKKQKHVTINKIRKKIFNQTRSMGADACISGKTFNFDTTYKDLFLKSINIAFDRTYDYDKEMIFVLRILELGDSSKVPEKDLTE